MPVGRRLGVNPSCESIRSAGTLLYERKQVYYRCVKRIISSVDLSCSSIPRLCKGFGGETGQGGCPVIALPEEENVANFLRAVEQRRFMPSAATLRLEPYLLHPSR